ncbi:MAG: aminodeoxychorismate/anthranilate synthase component II [Myxococcales bacterium FL481]|nr:MAG: aminodeoxychorismate/anthranilate synthase component II [Myxococcales bacterium FL481]
MVERRVAGVRVTMVDNHDSFTFNLVQYMLELGASVDVVAHDACSAADILARRPSHLVLSPGPGRPQDVPVCLELGQLALAGRTPPLLGVCLGHQALCLRAGAHVRPAHRIVHGKGTPVEHDGHPLFDGVPSPLMAGRYHSLVVDPGSLPPSLRPIASTAAGELMAVAHSRLPVFGVQFHPESVLTENGHRLLANFLRFARGPA